MEPETLGVRVGPGVVAVVIEPDPLLRLHVESAVRHLGFSPANDREAGRAAAGAVFVGLGPDAECLWRVVPARPTSAASPLVIGYAAGNSELLAAHRVHACCDLFLELQAVGGQARFAYLRAGSIVEQARLTAREADVLVLVLGGASTADVAARLCVAPATARTHCRALLRKLGAADRRALRARLLAAAAAAETPLAVVPTALVAGG